MNNPQSYMVAVLRSDGNHIIMDEAVSFEGAREKWIYLTRYWEECVKEKKPFIIESPIVTAFDPSMIYEIVLRPKSTTTSNNPYQKEMQSKGLSEMMKGAGLGAGLLDGGYR